MTALLYAIDALKEEVGGVTDVSLNFDEENPTNTEEILQEKMTSVLVKPASMADFAGLAKFQQEREKAPQPLTQMYVNNKGQLIKLTESMRNGRKVQHHQIMSFDVNKLPQATKHSYQGAAVTTTG